jgi:hypothetical protein
LCHAAFLLRGLLTQEFTIGYEDQAEQERINPLLRLPVDVKRLIPGRTSSQIPVESENKRQHWIEDRRISHELNTLSLITF